MLRALPRFSAPFIRAFFLSPSGQIARRSGRTIKAQSVRRRQVLAATPGDKYPHQSNSYEAVLEELRTARHNRDLRNYVLENETSLGIDFFLWLSEIEYDANDSGREELDSLIGEVICIREGLDVLTPSSKGGPESQEMSTGGGEGLLPSEGSTGMARVDDFRREVDSCKQAAVVGLIGRQDLPTLEDVQRMEHAAASANVANRIVDVLLDIPEGPSRKAALVDALTPPASGDEIVGDDQEELLYTSPFTLLVTLDTELAQDNGTATTEFDENTARAQAYRVHGLLRLREDIQAYLDQPDVKFH